MPAVLPVRPSFVTCEGRRPTSEVLTLPTGMIEWLSKSGERNVTASG